MAVRIPKHWQQQIDSGTAFGDKAAAAIEVLKQQPVVMRSATSPQRIANKEKVGTALKARITSLLKVKTKEGCGCNNLAEEMDRGGIAWCEANRDYIVGHLVKNKDMLVSALAESGSTVHTAIGWAVGVPFVADAALRLGANWLLTQAIEESRHKPRKIAARTNRRGNSRVYTGWRSEADGPRPPLGPFVSTIRHLTYHVWPAMHTDSWKWNLEQLAKRWQLFNGKRIIGIVHDAKSVGPDEVVKFAVALGMHFDHFVIRKNVEKQREVVTWLSMLKLLNPTQAGPEEVVFSAHAKGVHYDSADHTMNWADLMYRSCLDDWSEVSEALRTTLMAGSFKEFGLFGKWYNWAYSGTFFWWRLQELGKRKWEDVDQWFCGTESWPGKHCKAEETSCLFLNDSKRMYEEHYWRETVWPVWLERERRLGRVQ